MKYIFIFFLLCLVVLAALIYLPLFLNLEKYSNITLSDLGFERKNAATEEKQLSRKTSILRFQPDVSHTPIGLYITAWPNHGAGVGHQFNEWIQGLWAAHKYNITYVHTPFLINSAFWNSFFGFGINEMTEDDLKIRHAVVNVAELNRERGDKMPTESWILQHRSEFIKNLSKPDALLLRLYRVNDLIYGSKAACFPPINVKLRLKYCAARIIQPVAIDLFEHDRSSDSIIVAIHARCGDSCYDSYRSTTPSSLKNTLLDLHNGLSAFYQNKRIAFHLFSEHARNDTAENFFQLLLNNSDFQAAKPFPIQIVPHFSVNALITMHHLITADILLTARSAFSEIASILRSDITFGLHGSCIPQLIVTEYNKELGNFSLSSLKNALQFRESLAAKQNRPINAESKTMDQCRTTAENSVRLSLWM